MIFPKVHFQRFYFVGNILINGQLLKRKPLFSITIALWLKLDTNRGQQNIFSTCNPDNPWNSHMQYSLDIIDGRVKWFHRSEKSQVSYHNLEDRSATRTDVTHNACKPTFRSTLVFSVLLLLAQSPIRSLT